jgi:hypothetical protein
MGPPGSLLFTVSDHFRSQDPDLRHVPPSFGFAGSTTSQRMVRSAWRGPSRSTTPPSCST